MSNEKDVTAMPVPSQEPERKIRSMDDMRTWKDFIENLDLVPDGTKMRIGDGPWVTLDSKRSKKALAETKPISHLVQ